MAESKDSKDARLRDPIMVCGACGLRHSTKREHIDCLEDEVMQVRLKLRNLLLYVRNLTSRERT